MDAVYFGWRISRKLKENNGWVLFILVGVFRGNLRETMGGWLGAVYFSWRISGNLRKTMGGCCLFWLAYFEKLKGNNGWVGWCCLFWLAYFEET